LVPLWGRPGGAGAPGASVCFACENDSFLIPEIEVETGVKMNCLHPDPELLLDLPPARIEPVVEAADDETGDAAQDACAPADEQDAGQSADESELAAPAQAAEPAESIEATGAEAAVSGEPAEAGSEPAVEAAVQASPTEDTAGERPESADAKALPAESTAVSVDESAEEPAPSGRSSQA
jgi:ATP-dependent RNA helicase RhlB